VLQAFFFARVASGVVCVWCGAGRVLPFARRPLQARPHIFPVSYHYGEDA